jgi:hypothetical protein
VMVLGSRRSLLQPLRTRLLMAVSWAMLGGSCSSLVQPPRSKLLRAVSWLIMLGRNVIYGDLMRRLPRLLRRERPCRSGDRIRRVCCAGGERGEDLSG